MRLLIVCAVALALCTAVALAGRVSMSQLNDNCREVLGCDKGGRLSSQCNNPAKCYRSYRAYPYWRWQCSCSTKGKNNNKADCNKTCASFCKKTFGVTIKNVSVRSAICTSRSTLCDCKADYVVKKKSRA